MDGEVQGGLLSQTLERMWKIKLDGELGYRGDLWGTRGEVGLI